MKNLYNVFFSPTDSTRDVLDCLSMDLKMVAEDVDLTLYQNRELKAEFTKDDLVLIGVPSYAGRVPQTFTQRFAENISGNGALAVLVVTFGNRAYEDTLIELKDLAEKNNFKVIAAAAVVTQHSIVPEFGAGRPDMEDKKELKSFAKQIKAKITTEVYGDIAVSGNRPYKMAIASSMAPRLDKDKCISCGTCVVACPTHAIDEFSFECEETKCISCLRCIKVCPMNCRYVPMEILNKLKEHLTPLCASRKNNEFFI